MFISLKEISNKLAKVFLAAITVVSVMNSVPVMTINAADTLSASDLGIEVLVNNDSGDKIVPGDSRQDIEVSIRPELTALSGKEFNDVTVTVKLPVGTKIESGWYNVELEVATLGTDTSHVYATTRTDASGTYMDLRITNIQAWASLANGGSIDYRYGFNVSNLFPNYSTKENDTATVSVSYGSKTVPVTIVANGGALSWNSSNLSAVNFSQVAYADGDKTDAISTSPLIVNLVPDADKAIASFTYTPVLDTKGMEGTKSVVIEQTITLPAGVTVGIADLEISSINGASATVTPIVSSGVTTGYKLTWNVTSGFNIPADAFTTSVRVKKVSYDAQEVFSNGSGGKITTNRNLVFPVTTTAVFTGVDGGTHTAPVRSGNLTITAANPFKVINYSTSAIVNTKITGELMKLSGAASDSNVLVGGFNFDGTPSWNIQSAILDSSPIGFEVAGFGNTLSSNLTNFTVTQDFSLGTSTVFDNAHEKVHINTIVLGQTEGPANKPVTVRIYTADGSFYQFTKNAGETVHLATQQGQKNGTGALVAIPTLDGAKGNIVSISYNYGEVEPGFKLVSGEANIASGNVVPHYIRTNSPAAAEYVWSDLETAWNDSGNDFQAFNELMNLGNSKVDGTQQQYGAATVSYTDPTSAVQSNKVEATRLPYFNPLPSTSDNKDSFNITKNSSTSLSYDDGDEVEFIVMVRNDDRVSRDLGTIVITDIMEGLYVDSVLTDVTWEIYKLEDLPDANAVTNLHYALVNKSSKIIASTTSPGVSTDLNYGVGITGGDKTDWVDGGANFDAEWTWNGRLSVGYGIVFRYNVKLDIPSSGPGQTLENDYKAKAAFFYSDGSAGGWFELAGGGSSTNLDPTPTTLDVKIKSASEAANASVLPGDNDVFTINAKVRSSTAVGNKLTGDAVVAAVLPYGWNVNASTFDVRVNGISVGVGTGYTVALETTTRTVGTETLTSQRYVFTVKNLEAYRNSNATYSDADIQITFTAKSPSMEIVNANFAANTPATGAYLIGAVRHDRTYASLSFVSSVVGDDGPITSYKLYGKLLKSSKIGTAGLTDMNKAYDTTNPATIMFNSGGSYFTDRLITEDGLDAIPAYGHVNWDGLVETTSRLNTYAETVYTNINLRPEITIINDSSATSIDLSTGTPTYKYIITVSNKSGDTYDLPISKLALRTPQYFGAPTVESVNLVSGTPSPSVARTVTTEVSSTSSLQTGHLSYIDFTSNLVLGPNTTYEIVVTGNVVPSTFGGTSGYGNKYDVATLRNQFTARVAMIPAASVASVPRTAPSAANGLLNTHANSNRDFFCVDDSTNATLIKPFVGTAWDTDTTNNWFVSNSVVTPVTRASIAPHIEKSVEFNSGTPTSPDWHPVISSINQGSDLRWTITIKNPANGSPSGQADIVNATVYDVLPAGFQYNLASLGEPVIDGTGITGFDPNDITFSYDATTGILKWTGIDLPVGKQITFKFVATIPTSGISTLITNNAYLVPANTISFTSKDVPTGGGTYYEHAQLPSSLGVTSSYGGVHAAHTVTTRAGDGAGIEKSAVATINGTATPLTSTTIENVSLGTKIDYTLTVLNATADSGLTKIVIADALPHSSSTATVPVRLDIPVAKFNGTITAADYNDAIEVYLVEGDGTRNLLTEGTDYDLMLSASTTVSAGALTSPYDGTTNGFKDVATYVSDDNAAYSSADYGVDTVRSIRVEYTGPAVEMTEKLEVVLKTRVVSRDDILNGYNKLATSGTPSTNPVDSDNRTATNTFKAAFNTKTNKRIDELVSNEITVRTRSSSVTIDTFIDTDSDGIKNGAETRFGTTINGSATVYEYDSVTQTKGASVGTLNYNTNNALVLYDLDPAKEYIVEYSEAVSVTGDLYYWYNPSSTLGANASKIDLEGKYVIGSVAYGSQLNVLAGFVETGPIVSGYIWDDANKNGINESFDTVDALLNPVLATETRLANVELVIYRINQADCTIHVDDVASGYATTYTDADGYYEFNLDQGGVDSNTLFMVKVILPTGYNTFTTQYATVPPAGMVLADEDVCTVVLSPAYLRPVGPSEYEYDGSLANANGEIRVIKAPINNINVGLYYNPPITGVGEDSPTAIYITAGLVSVGIAIALIFKKRREVGEGA